MNDQSLNQNDKPVKPCIKCGASDRYSDGECRPCSKARARERYNENKEKELERSRAFRERNPNYGKDWRRKNLDKHRAQCREWHVKNAEKSKTNKLAWRRNNKQRMREREREWRVENPELARRRDQNRRNAVKSAGGKLSNDIVIKLMNRQRGRCACCGQLLNGKYHLDHIMPLALGGTNTDDNVQLLLPRCNLSKGARHPIDYMRSKGKLL